MYISPVYIWLLVFLCVSVCFPKNKPLIYLNIAFMLFLGVMRGITVGTDCLGYSFDYYILDSFKDVYKIRHSFEIGFIALIIGFKKCITEDYLPFVSLIFIPFFWGCLKFIHYRRESFPLALFFLYTWGHYFAAYNIMRQMMALGIMLIFMPLLYKRKYLYFSFAVIVTALLFHQSGLFMLFLIPLHYYVSVRQRFPSKRLLYLALIVSFSTFFVGKTYLQSILSPILLLFDSNYIGYILGYEEEELGFTANLGQTLIACMLVYLYRRGKMDMEMVAFTAAVVLYNLLGIFSSAAPRLTEYWTIFGIVLFPYFINENKTRNKKVFLLILFLYSLIRFFNAYYINNAGEINPYVLR